MLEPGLEVETPVAVPVYLRFTPNLCTVHGCRQWSAQRCEHNRAGEVGSYGVPANMAVVAHIS